MAREVEIKAWRAQKGTEHEGACRARCSRNASENPIADKEYDNASLVEFAVKNGIHAVIPPRRNAKISRIYDKELHKKRHIVEKFFLKIKKFRSISTRYTKNIASFQAYLTIASIMICCNPL